jgi:hypothetical protein
VQASIEFADDEDQLSAMELEARAKGAVTTPQGVCGCNSLLLYMHIRVGTLHGTCSREEPLPVQSGPPDRSRGGRSGESGQVASALRFFIGGVLRTTPITVVATAGTTSRSDCGSKL